MNRLQHNLQRAVRIAANPVRRQALSLVRRLNTGPKVLANSYPKAGTHLLSRCLDLLPDMVAFHDGVYIYHGERHSPVGKRRSLAAMGGACYVMAHLPYAADYETALTKLDFKHILIVRDPRDVVVSWVKFEMKHRYLPYYHYFHALPDDNTRLLRAIEGDPTQQVGDFGRRIDAYLPWLDRDVCVVRFEELVGERGGGSAAQQVAAIERITQHLGMALSSAQIADVAERLFTSRSRTFRKGVIGDWANHFDERHKAAFKPVANDALVKLGYAEDAAW